MRRPSQPLRVLLAVALVLAVATLMLTLLSAADAALSVWQRLQELPGWMRAGYVLVLALLGAAAGWGVWRLLNPRAARAPRAEAIDRGTLERRIEGLPADAAPARDARRELEELDRRRAEAQVQVALFGDISAGKSSLLRALLPQAGAAVGVVGGTTREVARHRGVLPDGTTPIEIADVPGLHEADDREHAALARAEAARSHAVLFVADGDLTRSQDRELQTLAAYGRPLLLLLNKIDRYHPDERDALLARLRQRYAGPGVHVLAVSAGRIESVPREWPDGRREIVEREAPAELGDLPAVLQGLARAGAAALEPGREAALLAHVDAQLAEGERVDRAARSQATVEKYTRRAVVGALAAVAPGTDLVIQGALATALLRELCAIHGLGVRDVDLDAFLGRAGGLVRTTTSITLAIAGNALKAFPGLGTLGGGLLHAVAYGLIFDSLGRAVAQTLAETRALDREATLQRFRAELEAPAGERLRALAGLALDAWRERGAVDAGDGDAARRGVRTP
jgi:small GTP-binding protein